MERLTPKDLHPYEVKNFADKFNDKGDDPCFRSKVIDKLWEYENAEEQGLIVKLPCKVGDYLYCVNKYKKSDAQYKVFKCYISNYTHCKDEIDDYLTVRFVEENIIDVLVYPIMIGEHYFLTEAEALQALKERE